jgi:uncharacterized Fe-S cluster protein YjdI
MASEEGREARYEPTVERVYRNDAVEITWEPRFCTHWAACIGGAPEVFNPQRRPWIDVDAAAPEQILETVARCPTGALHARWVDGREGETPPAPVEFHVQLNGPIFVRGTARVINAEGEVVREDWRLALCRCGASQNKPFCDDSHYRIGFTG